jgi:hypothetical protein
MATAENIKSNEGQPTEPKTIYFDVGGQLYRVSRSMIELHQDTMLARLVSDTWLTDPTATIYIDRDGERFKYVLDYLRYGKVSLPLSIPKEMFLLDMEYYGFAYRNDNDTDKEVTRSTLDPSQIDEIDAIKQATLKLSEIILSTNKEIVALRKEKDKQEKEIKYLEMAMEFAKKYIFNIRDTKTLQVSLAADEGNRFVWDFQSKAYVQVPRDEKDDELLNRCLARFSLKVTKTEIKPWNGQTFHFIDTI